MQMTDTNLSNNPAELKNIIRVLTEQLQEKESVYQQKLNQTENELTRYQAESQRQQSRINQLEHQLRLALQFRFGKSSEKTLSPQLKLFDEPRLTVEEEKTVVEADHEITVARFSRKTAGSGRKPLPKDLPREQIIHDLLDTEKVCACGHALHKLGEDRSEQLEFIPAQVKVIEHIRYKYACRSCCEGVKIASLPPQPIPKSIAAPGLLAHVLVSKYNDHIPLYRQEHILQRYEIDIARSTLCHWVLSCGELFQPLIDEMKQQIVNHHYLCVDETPVQVLTEKGKPKLSNSYMWSYLTGPPENRLILYDYQSSRAGAAVTTFLEEFKGYLQTDGYGGYNQLQAKPAIKAVGCWAHARRKFVEIIKASKKAKKAEEAVNIIKQLYAIESEAKAQQFNTQATQQLRQEKAKPLLERFKLWLEETLKTVPPQSPIAKAIQYTLNQWGSLIAYIEDGELMIDNNAVENIIRPFALGRKNWLFLGNERGGKAAANIYSLIMTAKANQIEPYRYLRYLLTELPKCKTQKELQLLLPQYCKEKLLQPNLN